MSEFGSVFKSESFGMNSELDAYPSYLKLQNIVKMFISAFVQHFDHFSFLCIFHFCRDSDV